MDAPRHQEAPVDPVFTIQQPVLLGTSLRFEPFHKTLSQCRANLKSPRGAGEKNIQVPPFHLPCDLASDRKTKLLLFPAAQNVKAVLHQGSVCIQHQHMAEVLWAQQILVKHPLLPGNHQRAHDPSPASAPSFKCFSQLKFSRSLFRVQVFSSILPHCLRCHLVSCGCVGCQRRMTQWPCSPWKVSGP